VPEDFAGREVAGVQRPDQHLEGCGEQAFQARGEACRLLPALFAPFKPFLDRSISPQLQALL